MEDEERFFRDSRPEVVETFTPVFVDELTVTDEVAMTCEENPQCIFDLTVTGNREVAANALNHEKETNLTEGTISETDIGKMAAVLHFTCILQPTSPQTFQLLQSSVGQEAEFTLTVEDPGDEVTLTVLGGPPPNAVLQDVGRGEHVLRWTLQTVTTAPLTFLANDSRGASSTHVPSVEICACANGGTCTREGLLATNATTTLNCVCPEGTVAHFQARGHACC